MPIEQLYPDQVEHDELTIRCFNMDDAEDLSSATNSSYEQLRDWVAWVKPVMSIGESEALCIQFEDEYRGGKDFRLGVWDHRGLVGGAAFHPTGEYEAEIGLWVRTSNAGRGIGTRIVEGLLEWGFREWEWDVLRIKCDMRNSAFARVAEKAGLDKTESLPGGTRGVDGTPRDCDVYEITKADWKKSAY